jgi:hypothetical protein
LAAPEVEVVDGGGDCLCEGVDSPAKLIVGGKGGTFCGEGLTLVGELGSATVELMGSPFHLGKLDQPALVQVSETVSFSVGVGDFAVEAAQLDGKQLVVGSRSARAYGCLSGSEDVGFK